jgi:molybdopterin adenylyltransferase
MAGTIVAVNISERKGTRKHNVQQGRLIAGSGLEGDAHAGPWHRQVSLLAEESIDKMRGKGTELAFGDFAENFTTRGLDLLSLSLGTRLQVGEKVSLEITQIGKECHQDCEIRTLVGDCVMPREGVFARVLEGGAVTVGDTVRVLGIQELAPGAEKESQRRAAVLTISDSCAAMTRTDESGPWIAAALREAGWEVVEVAILPDEREEITRKLLTWCDLGAPDLVLTTGGTGFGPRDWTPEATLDVIERKAAGISEALRADGLKRTPTACLSRGQSGLRGKTLVINLPGSLRAVGEGMEFLLPLLPHALKMIQGGGH